MKKGSIKLLASDENLLAYGRFEADEQIVVVVNNSDELRTVTVPVWYAGVEMEGRMKRLIYSYENGYTTEYDEYIDTRWRDCPEYGISFSNRIKAGRSIEIDAVRSGTVFCR